MPLTRRKFLANTLIGSAGAMLFEHPVRMLGQASSIPQIGANVFYASQNGCVADCVVATGAKVGGGTPTDNTAALNALLVIAGAAPGGGKVILDGGFAHKGIFLPSNVTIEGIEPNLSGLFLISGSNTHCISNWTSSTQASMTNMTLRNFTINGNYPNNGATGSFECGIFIYKASNIIMEGVTMINVTYFNVLFETVTNVYTRGCTITSTHLNADGFHISGGAGCSNLKFFGHSISTFDDAIALNAPENQGGPSTGGPITDVQIVGNTFTGFGVRMYSSASGSARVSRVQVVNNSGSMVGQSWSIARAYLLGNSDNYADGIDSFSASNSNYVIDSTGNYIHLTDSAGNITLDQETWTSPVAARAFAYLDKTAIAISQLVLNNCTIYRSTLGNSAAYGLACDASAVGSSIGRLVINGFHVVNQAGQSYSAIPYLIDMANTLSIGELVIAALDSSLITALVNPTTGFTGITKISGAGVLATGFQIPDSIMANDTPYISATGANAGLPCIKVGGTVYPYVLA